MPMPAPKVDQHGGRSEQIAYEDLRPALDSPTRPNPIGLSLVRLVKREGRRLVVEGIDVFDGTPILDIKGYSAGYRTESYTAPRWLE
jgi:tRNA (Thr-GGU) A37 N-methylase